MGFVHIMLSYYSTESDSDDIAMGIMIALVSLMLVTVYIIFLLFCIYHHNILNQITQEKTIMKNEEHGMMPYPEPTYVNTTEPIPEPVYVNTADSKDQ